MSLNMYLGEVRAQTESMNASCTATIEGMEQAIQSIDIFVGDAVLQGKTYDSAKIFFLQTFRPLAQGIIYLCEELIRQNNAFPADFQAEVATVDVIEQEILEQIRELQRMIAEVESMSEHMSGMDALLHVYYAMKRKLEDKLERLYQFNASSSDNYATAIELAANIAKGLAEVQSGKSFSLASGIFSTKELNMEWATSIQAIVEERNHQANKIEDGNTEESDVLQDSSSEKSMLEKIVKGVWDGSGQAVGTIIEGFKSLDDTVTKENIKYAIGHPIETVSTMWNTFSDSFMNDVWYGDAESITKWGTNTFVQLGLGWMGDKGLSKVGKVTTLGTKNPQGISNFANELNNGNQFAFTGDGTQHYFQKAVTYTYEGPNGPKTIRLRKGDLAGDKHPVTGVPYDADGFPIFEPKGEVMLKEKDFKKSRPTHDRICNKALYQQILENPQLAAKFTDKDIEALKRGDNPRGYTWHHHQDPGRMQLVEYELHKDTGHTGGYRIWGKDSDK